MNKRDLLLAGLVWPAAAWAAGQTAVRDATDVTDTLGRRVSIPAAPQRVLTLSERDLDCMLALGLKPLGSTQGRGESDFPGYLRERSAGVANLGAMGRPSMDRVLSLKPDLILAGGLADPALLQQLSRIAPTLATFAAAEPWADTLRRLAVCLGRSPQAEAFVAAYQARAAVLRRQLPAQQGRSASLLRWTPQGPVYMKGEAFAGQVLADLGLLRPAAQREPGAGHSPPLSREALDRIDGDWIFVGLFRSGAAHDPAGLASLQRQPEFRALRAAKAGQVREVDASLWTVLGGPLAALAVLEQAASMMSVAQLRA